MDRGKNDDFDDATALRIMSKEDNLANLPPYNWVKDANIYNHNYKKIDNEWITNNVDIIILNFSMKGKDRGGIMERFFEIYENAKYSNIPIEVVNIPMDETKDDMCLSYDDQANWFTLMFDDPLIITLIYYYNVSSVPRLIVIRTDGFIVSTHGILDLDMYGKNALITWLSNKASVTTNKRLSKELSHYGPTWRYLSIGVGKTARPDYLRRFSLKAQYDDGGTPFVLPAATPP